MDLPRYTFRRECEEELLEFIKVAAKHKPAIPEDINLWKALLPVDKEIQKKIDSFNTTTIDEIIEIIESDEEKIEGETKPTEKDSSLSSQAFMQLSKNESGMNVTAVEDMIDGIEELLQTEPVLNKTVIKQIGNEFSTEKLQLMFTSLAKRLSSECTLKMWKSIIGADCAERHVIACYFAECILIEKILHEHNNSIKALFIEVFEECPNEVIGALKKALFEKGSDFDLMAFKNNLSVLADDQKNTVLSTFDNNCQKLELHHITIIQALLTPSANVETLMKIIDLMSQTAKEFSSDKCFGKVVLEMIQNLGPNVLRSEQQLKYIILNHKSVFKAKIVKLFDSSLQDHKMFSQSFSM